MRGHSYPSLLGLVTEQAAKDTQKLYSSNTSVKHDTLTIPNKHIQSSVSPNECVIDENLRRFKFVYDKMLQEKQKRKFPKTVSFERQKENVMTCWETEMFINSRNVKIG